MKPGSASIERQEETQAPHWMQAIDWVMSIIDSGSTTYSRSGGSPWGSSQGVTRRIFFQCVDSMSVTRSLTTGMLPIGSMTIGAAARVVAVVVPGPASYCPVARTLSWLSGDWGPIGLEASAAVTPMAAFILFACSWASPIWVLQASPDWPLIFIPQDPQIAARQEQRTASEPSSRSLAWRMPSRTEREGSRSTLNSSQKGPSPLS